MLSMPLRYNLTYFSSILDKLTTYRPTRDVLEGWSRGLLNNGGGSETMWWERNYA